MITSKDISTLNFDDPDLPACMAIMPFVKSSDVGVEIGVYQGTSSEVFLRNCAFMYLIDPCIDYSDNLDTGWICREDQYLQTMAPFEGGFQFIKKMSHDAIHEIPQVDFVFIDGNHTFDYVLRDAQLYWEKVKEGGILCGHDYGAGHQDVVDAVHAFSESIGKPIEVHKYCWLIRK